MRWPGIDPDSATITLPLRPRWQINDRPVGLTNHGDSALPICSGTLSEPMGPMQKIFATVDKDIEAPVMGT
ncbi:hypothetical protein CBM2592_B50005 [Cupriavidus taiwanensis]|nr:hypothetical protein CBM2588_B40227 [Cupriavidus taiwanensis]SOY72361.1 hypothetical protein CBM2592_B50005 [Cupriavidus taiwanensis]SOY95929.1 hypothetical protein CBM2591_B30005 [Cupriavidus taiwanensis]SOZ75052.1 hypothetical protein CBM2617_B60326 [Cupriavidus taiwanensis]SOZ88598.1 hypothetical protein CBM2618_B50330 [Cupriavidus taiwanensis]